jgi:hypothetical protein
MLQHDCQFLFNCRQTIWRVKSSVKMYEGVLNNCGTQIDVRGSEDNNRRANLIALRQQAPQLSITTRSLEVLRRADWS